MKKKNTAFTLIETIIVIIVFAIGILAVLYGMSQTIRNQDYASTQIKSAFFAREWIELVFNLRDANYHKELPWNCIFEWIENLNEDTWCKNLLKPWKVLKLGIGEGNKYLDVDVTVYNEESFDLEDDRTFDRIFEDYKIYKHNWEDNNPFMFNHIETDWEETWFARFILIKSVEWINSDNNILKVESHVLYKKWALKWEKVMETFIGNYDFRNYAF